MNELRIIGEVEVNGKVIKHIEGGFGEGSRIITDKDIAVEHDITPSDVRKLINRNINRFKEGIDYIDLMNCPSSDDQQFSLENFGYTKMQIGKAGNIYILSERGYSKVIKIMDSDLAWEIHDQLMDNYFTMRKIINSDEQLKAKLLLDIYNGGEEGLAASKRLAELEAKPLKEENKKLQPLAQLAEERIDKKVVLV